MAFMRAYSMGNAGPGRGPRRGDPFLGGLIGTAARFAAPLLRKVAGKGLAALTGGKLIGSGGAKSAAKKILIGAGGITALRQIPNLPGPFQNPFGRGGRKYRRMNAGNAKALRRAFRRIDAFTKLASKAGYVRRKPFGARRSK